MTRMARLAGAAALFFLGLAAGDLHADVPPTPPPSASAAPSPSPSALSLTAVPAFGVEEGAGDGWLEIVAHLANAGAVPAKGTLEVSARGTYTYGGQSASFVVRAPFNVQPRGSAVIRMPMHGAGYGPPTLTLTATSDRGASLAETTVSLGSSTGPLLIDVHTPSPLSVVMRGWPMSPAWHPPSYSGGGSSVTLSVGSPPVDATTGDPLLPERPAAYADVTAVVIASDQLARLQGMQHDALVGWVLAGGTIAVYPTRPEDLRAGVLTSLAGGAISTAPPPPVMMTLAGAVRPGGTPSLGAPPITPPPPSPTTTPIAYVVPVRTTPLATAGVGPGPALRPKLVGFTGGNLQPSNYGATATYGLGQVHVLGFDPTRSPAVEDPWTHARLLELVEDAWDRRSLEAFPYGRSTPNGSNLYDVHRALDPNENFRPALGIAAILLILYSIAAGPLTFMRAHKRGRPLDPLVWVPVASAGCFALIVLVGLAGKGWSGRARHLSLAEVGAGMTRGGVRRFRGFFASQTRAMRVRASEADSVLDVATADWREGSEAALRLDKDGASLEDLTSLPWQTVVVGEDGFADLGGGIAVREKSDGSVVVANHTGRTMKNVIVWAPKTDASYFASIPNGVTILSSAGRTLFTASARSASSAAGRVVHDLDTTRFAVVLGSRAVEDMAPAWAAMQSAAGPSVDWWPDNVPVVLGEMDGGEGVKTDSGLRVESDRLLVRVVGEGGAT
jgi:hypothetical protein